jgi:hypothetical protein
MPDLREINAQLREMVGLMAEQGTARDNLIALQARQLAGHRSLIDNQDELIKALNVQVDTLTRLVELLEADVASRQGTDAAGPADPAQA